jgi:hypothetical protein
MENKENNFIKSKIEHTPKDIKIIKINIFNTESPYFFIRNALLEKSYRVSISFEYLNKKHGIDIGVIRNFEKIDLFREDSSSLNNFLKSFTEIYRENILEDGTEDNKMNFNLENLDISEPLEIIFKNILIVKKKIVRNGNKNTSIFLIEKFFIRNNNNDTNENSKTLVYFSEEFPNINIFLNNYLKNK